jgi:hypothetical protein
MVVVTAPKMIENVIFIRLKVSTRSAKIAEEEAKQWLNDALSKLNPKN